MSVWVLAASLLLTGELEEGSKVCRPAISLMGQTEAIRPFVITRNNQVFSALVDLHSGALYFANRNFAVFESEFHEGLAPVGMISPSEKVYGYINPKGSLVIPFAFKQAGNFREGFAAVETEDGWNIVRADGTLLLKKSMASRGFREGKAAVFDFATRKHLYIDHEGNPLFGKAFTEARNFHEGIAIVGDHKIAGMFAMYFGLIDSQGNKITDTRFQGMGDFSEGLVAISESNLWGYANANGDVVIKPAFKNALAFHGGLAAALDGRSGKWGFIDAEGGWKIQPAYRFSHGFFGGRAVVEGFNRKFGAVDEAGTVLIPLEYDHLDSFRNGYAAFRKGNVIGYLDLSGKVIWTSESLGSIFTRE